MRRLTTPTHYFNFPIEIDTIKEILLTYAQHNEIVLNKTKEDFTFDGNTGSITLTQEETALFEADDSCCKDNAIEIQLRVLTIDEKALATDIYKVPCRRVLNDEVLV